MKFRFYVLVGSILLTTANIAFCSESSAIDDQVAKALDATIKCGGCNTFSKGEGYFNLPDYGCMYSPSAKYNLGLAEVYIIEKKPQSMNSLSEDAQIQKVNALKTDQIKNNFDVYIYIVDKKYLQFFPKGDSPYEAKYPYVQALYNYDNHLNKWVLINQVTVTAQNLQVTLSQRDHFIQEKVKLYSSQKLENASSPTTDTPFIADAPKKMTVRLKQANYRTKPDKFDATNIIGVVKQNTDVTIQGHQKVGDTVWFLVSVNDDQILGFKKNGTSNSQQIKGWLSEKVFLP